MIMVAMIAWMMVMIRASLRACKELNLSVATSVIFESVFSARAHIDPCLVFYKTP